jgi:hypothetical protein
LSADYHDPRKPKQPLQSKVSLTSHLGPLRDRERLVADTATIMDFVHSGQQQLLAHPVCRVFALLKWHRYRKLWTAYLILNTIFVVSLSVFEAIFHGYLDYDMVGNPHFLSCPIGWPPSPESDVIMIGDNTSAIWVSRRFKTVNNSLTYSIHLHWSAGQSL